MNIPADLRFTKNDEWIRVEDNTGTIGISDYAQDQLSDVVYVEVSVGEGDSVSKGDVIAAVESVKAASDVYSPVSGTITAVNETLADTPENINSAPYQSWMVKIDMSDPAELEGLMDAAGYEAYLGSRDH
ncbi:MAG: glycine cleavage system protein GcvH [Anaerolineae bacterium]|nr:glycine cleavage system protein GcvH [Anaerolineae bacterium]